MRQADRDTETERQTDRDTETESQGESDKLFSKCACRKNLPLYHP